jgi:DNA-binding CsgD family transcriptional regulator
LPTRAWGARGATGAGSRPPDPRAVAVALLGLLRSISRDQPVLVAADDIQWLDSATALALAFVMRRLRDEPVGFLLARRVEDGETWVANLDRLPLEAGVERLQLGPLGPPDVGRLIDAELGLTLAPPVVRRIQAMAGGNPFLALELARHTARPSGADDGAEGTLPDALAVVAALAHPTVDRVTQATGRPATAILQPALDTRVLELSGERLAFAHPLLASAAWDAAPAGRRREIHARLATIVAGREERARHLALAASGPDEAVAAELEAAALHAQARGATDAGAELAGLARSLTPPERTGDARRRGLTESDLLLASGDAVRARALATMLLEEAPPGLARAEARLRVVFVDINDVDVRSAIAGVHAAIAETDDMRLRMRCEGVLTAALDAIEEDVAEAVAHGLAELDLAEQLDDAVHVATALRGIARNEMRLTGRWPAARIERAMALEPIVRDARWVVEWPSWCLAEMLAWTDDIAGAIEMWEQLRRAAAERGEEHSLGMALSTMCGYECIAGSFASALAHADDGLDLVVDTGHPLRRAATLAGRAFVAAHLGDVEAVRRDAAAALPLAIASGSRHAERAGLWALGLLELSLGNAADAHEHLGPVVTAARHAGIRDPGALRFVPDDVEALIGAGRLDEAAELLDWFAQLADDARREHARAAVDRCRGMLLAARGDGRGAIEALEASRTRYEQLEHPFDRARTLLALGAAQRRSLRRRDARATLQAAVTMFDELGAAVWGASARRELGAISGRQASGDGLTAAEARVAELVADGRTNREVAAALYLTERTIESHLSRVYAKLGIRSRSELAAVWAGGELAAHRADKEHGIDSPAQ